MKRKISTVLLAAAIGISGSMLGAQSANAADQGTMPAGCSITPNAPTLSGSSIYFSGSGYCGPSGISSFIARLVHNYDGLPDVRVKTVSVAGGTGPSYSVSGTTCDGGGTTQYYVEAGFYRAAGDVIRTSSQRTLTHC